MKYFLLTLLLTTSALADTSVQIAQDYNKQMATALDKPNAALKKAAAPLISAREKAKDAEGAKHMRRQVWIKTDAIDVEMEVPDPALVAIFQTYDAARVKALEPAQKAAVARIAALRLSSEGKKPEGVAALDLLRTEIDAGKAAPLPIPSAWLVYTFEDRSSGARRSDGPTSGPASGKLTLNPDSTWIMEEKSGQTTQGNWKQTDGHSAALETGKETWSLHYRDKIGQVVRGSNVVPGPSDVVFIKLVHK